MAKIVGFFRRRPWWWMSRRVARITGGRSHRCEFTDREHGVLWGHHEGAFMNAYFDELIRRIDAAPVDAPPPTEP